MGNLMLSPKGGPLLIDLGTVQKIDQEPFLLQGKNLHSNINPRNSVKYASEVA